MTPAIIVAFCAGVAVGALVFALLNAAWHRSYRTDEAFADMAHAAGYRGEDEWGERP